MQNLSDLLKAIISGSIEGFTEFLPISSTAHMLLFSWLADFKAIQNNLFEIFIQLGAILAVIIIYRQKIFLIFIDLNNKKSHKFLLNLIFAFLPTALIGLTFHDFIKHFLFSNIAIAFALIFGGIIMILVDCKKREFSIANVDNITPIQAFFVGCFQSLAIIPGVSRSGATIIGGILLKFNRQTAAEFSFLLSIPTIAAASFFDLYKNYKSLTLSNLELLIAGFISAFIFAIIVIKWFIGYVGKHNFIPFAIYRITLGTIILLYLYL